MLAASTGRLGGASNAAGAGLEGRRRRDGAGAASSAPGPLPAPRAPPSATDRFTRAWQLGDKDTQINMRTMQVWTLRNKRAIFNMY